MNRINIGLLSACILFAAGACSSSSDSAPPDESTLSVAVAALTGADVSDACYNLTVTDGNGSVVWTQPGVCADSYGNGAAAISYVGPCDASANDHTVTVELVSLSNDAGVIPPTDYLNPCPVGSGCTQTAVCAENADVQVPFEITILLHAGLGFIDISVDFDFLECSAKLDCLDQDGEPLDLLFDPNGDLGQTVVLGFTCSWDECLTDGMWMYTDDIVISCSEGTAVVSAANSGPAPFGQTANILFAATVYSGVTGSTGAYQNIALGLAGGTNCTLQAMSTASATQLPGQTLPVGSGYPAVGWSVELTGPTGELECAQHPLDGSPAGVSSFYPLTPDERLFDNESFHAADCATTCVDDFECDDGEECTIDVCDPELQACVNEPVIDGTPCDDFFCLGGTCCNAFDEDDDGQSACDGDCDDSDPTVFFGALEVCGDGIDNDCNGLVDSDCCVPDCTGLECGDDGCGGSCGDCLPGDICDGGGCVAPPIDPCGDGICDPSEFCICELDCPFTSEACDGLDNDCDGVIDNGPDAVESCDDTAECTIDLCDPVLGCVFDDTSLDGAPCDGGAGVCLAGECLP